MNFTSPQFFLTILGITLFLVVIVVLWRNISWAPRGITPQEMIDHFGMAGMFPNSKPIRYGIVGLAAILLIFGALAFLPNSHDIKQTLQSPSLETVWATTKDYWLWILLFGIVAFVSLFFIPKEKEALAKKLQWVLAWVMFSLFIGFPLLAWMGFGDEKQSAQQQARLQQPESKPTLSMLPFGDSVHINPPVGHATVFTGSGFTTHCVYSDGTEGTVGDPVRPCGNGPMLYQFVRDTTGRANAVTYAFVRP
jgi:hypothetical protein